MRVVWLRFILLSLILTLLAIPLSATASEKSTLSRNEIALEKILALNNRQDDSFRFVVMGDSRSFPAQLKKTAEVVNSLNPDFAIHLGDIAINGKSEEFNLVMPLFDSIKSPLIAVAGNHDRSKGKNSGANFMKYFGRCEFTFEVKNVRFVTVDNSPGVLKKPQNERIKADLKSDKVRMLFMHAPPSGVYPKHNFKGGAADLVSIIRQSECDYSFFGHIHGYDHRMIGDKCHAYITGGAGSELNDWGVARKKLYHVLLVEVNGRDVKVTTVPVPKASR
jgi:predicted phosphodiesterase